MRNNNVIFFHVLNLCFLIIFNNIYDWQGRYFAVGFVTYLLPNILGLLLNVLSIGLIEKVIRTYSIRRIITPIILFITNEVCYFLIEKKVVFFGFFSSDYAPNIIPIDKNSYIIISSAALLSVILVFFIFEKKIFCNFVKNQLKNLFN